jgi:hypothetical protein
MRRKVSIPLSYAVISLLVPAAATAQQRGTAAPAPVTATVRPMAPAVAPPTIHVPGHPVAPVAPSHPGGHGFVPTAHPAAPRIPSRPVAPTAPNHNHPVEPKPTSVSNGHYLPPVDMTEHDNGVPGLGFDYPHYAATHPNSTHRDFQGGSISPFVGGGIYIPTMSYVPAVAPAETAAEEQPSQPNDAVAETDEQKVEEQAPPAPYVRPRWKETLTPSTEYIFVRRDGTVFFAVAYSWMNGNLQYVTQDGFRKLVPATTLDLDATTHFNEQRGVPFHSPA